MTILYLDPICREIAKTEIARGSGAPIYFHNAAAHVECTLERLDNSYCSIKLIKILFH